MLGMPCPTQPVPRSKRASMRHTVVSRACLLLHNLYVLRNLYERCLSIAQARSCGCTSNPASKTSAQAHMHGASALSDAPRLRHYASGRNPATNAPLIPASGVLRAWARPALARNPQDIASDVPRDRRWGHAEHVLDVCQKQLQQPAQLCSEQQLDLLVLDTLLGSLSTLVAFCAFVVACNGDMQATLLYAQARQLQQQLCNDLDTYAYLAGQLQQAEVQCGTQGSSQLGGKLTDTGTRCSSDERLAVLQRMLWHLQGKGDCCLVDAGSALSPAEQQLRYADVRSQGQALQQQLSCFLQESEASPQVDIDAASLQVLLHPIQAALDAQSAGGSSASLQHTSPGPAAQSLSSAPASQRLVPVDPAGPPATAVPNVMFSKSGGLLLTPALVQLVLQSHPDPEVRQQVYAAGILQRLDAVVQVWQQLAEVQRRVARSHGQPSAAALHLPHTLLGSTAAVQRFLLQLGEALQEPAQRQLQDLGLSAAAEAWELEHAAAQVQQARADCLQSYEDHTHLPTCLRHISGLLKPLLGVTLQEVQQSAPDDVTRPGAGDTADGEDKLLVFGVWAHDVPHDRDSTQADSNQAAGASGAPPCTLAGGRLDQTQHTALPSAAICSSSSNCQNVGKDLQDLDTDQPTAASHTNSTTMRLLGHVVISFGNRQSVTQLVPPGLGASLRDLGVTTAAAAEHHVDSLPLVMVSLQSQATGSSITSGALGLWEACHELGHALHFCLSASGTGLTGSSDSGGSSNGTPPTGTPYHLQAPWLPVEVLELPSSFLEHLAMSPECLRQVARHRVTGASLPVAAARQLAALIKDTYYSPLGLQHMVRLMLVDQQLLAWTKPWGGQSSTTPQAADAWSATQGLGAAPASACLLQQLQALPLVMRLPGQAHGYLVGWYLSLLLWEACWQPMERALVAAPLDVTNSQTPAAQELQGMKSKGGGPGDTDFDAWSRLNPAACACIRRCLFDCRADVEPSTLVANLLQQLAHSAHADSTPNAAARDTAADQAAQQGAVSVDALVLARWFQHNP